MWNLLADILTENEQVRYEIIFGVIFLYLLSLWLIIVFWVYRDALKRFEKKSSAVTWCLLVLWLNFPALILYFILRPEEDWSLPEHQFHWDGVNVPVAHFVGEDGVYMSLELKINSKALVDQHDMAIDVNWNGDRKNISIPAPVKLEKPQPEKKEVQDKGSFWDKFKKKASDKPAAKKEVAPAKLLDTKPVVKVEPEVKAEKPEAKVEESVTKEPEVEITPTEIIPEEVKVEAAPIEATEITTQRQAEPIGYTVGNTDSFDPHETIAKRRKRRKRR